MAIFERCRDENQGKPGCLGIADSRYTMRFDDIQEEPLYWCSSCGVQAQQMNAALQQAFKSRTGFAEALQKAMGQLK